MKMAGKPIHFEAFPTLSKSFPMRLKQLEILQRKGNYLEDNISIVKLKRVENAGHLKRLADT